MNITAEDVKAIVSVLAKGQLAQAAAASAEDPYAEYESLVAQNNAVLNGFVFQAVEANDSEYQKLAERVDDQATLADVVMMCLSQANQIVGPIVRYMATGVWPV